MHAGGNNAGNTKKKKMRALGGGEGKGRRRERRQRSAHIRTVRVRGTQDTSAHASIRRHARGKGGGKAHTHKQGNARHGKTRREGEGGGGGKQSGWPGKRSEGGKWWAKTKEKTQEHTSAVATAYSNEAEREGGGGREGRQEREEGYYHASQKRSRRYAANPCAPYSGGLGDESDTEKEKNTPARRDGEGQTGPPLPT